MFENIANFFKKLVKAEKKEAPSKDKAKERLHLVLMQDRANVSADFLELMKQEIIDVIKKYIEVEEGAIDVRLTNEIGENGEKGAPSLYANIPIKNIKNNIKTEEKSAKEDNKKEEKEEDKKEKVNEEKEEKEKTQTAKGENKENNKEEKEDNKKEEKIKELEESKQEKKEENKKNKTEKQEEKTEQNEEKKADSKEKKKSSKKE